MFMLIDVVGNVTSSQPWETCKTLRLIESALERAI